MPNINMTLPNTRKSHRWQTALINAVTDPQQLFKLLELDPVLLDKTLAASQSFQLKVPLGFIARMKKGDINDPLLRQIIPLYQETNITPGYYKDPLKEMAANKVPGLLHKYYGRVLLTFTGYCAINCRYCFRRHFPYEDNNPGSSGWEQALDYIIKDKTIHEVILSGGDPLVANDSALKQLTLKLADIPHVKLLRIHSRIPIVLPERVTPDLLEWMTSTRLKIILVVHSNHPQEINQEVYTALQPLRQAGIVLLNQTVLLKNINDKAEILAQLSHALFEGGILPYYLHVLDKVQGTAHFDLPLKEAQQIHLALTHLLPGYLVPKLACEQPGIPAKLLINDSLFYTA
jgi:L-lysine 2,3-aminomutase